MGFETNTIIGNPDESPADLEESLSLVFDCIGHGGAGADLSVLQPLPGAPVTEEHREYLVPEDNVQPGGFLPPEVRELVRDDLPAFSGFGFIRKGNREFGYYSSFVPIARFFTRHYFRTVHFLNKRCGLTYIEMFEWMAGESDPDRFPRRFARLVRERGSEEARSVHAYDDAVERIKGTELRGEVENTYSEPARTAGRSRYRLLVLPHEAHASFGSMPRRRTAYLLFSRGGRVVAVKLSNWQEEFWRAAEALGDAGKPGAGWTRRLVGLGVDPVRARTAVEAFSGLVEEVLGLQGSLQRE